jgi:DNA replication licensing factor MCM3
VEDDTVAQKETRVWQRGNAGRRARGLRHDFLSDSAAEEEFLSKEFVRKYVHYARNRVQPQLTDEATELVTNSYATMRSKQDQRNLPVTARSLETIIRLATAHAKARLSPTIDEVDVEVAMELMNYVLYHEIGDDA